MSAVYDVYCCRVNLRKQSICSQSALSCFPTELCLTQTVLCVTYELTRYRNVCQPFRAFYPRDAMLARVFATATCLSVRLSVYLDVRMSHAGVVPSRAKAGS